MNDSLYGEYMRSVLGYEYTDYPNMYEMNYNNFGVSNMSAMTNMQNEELEACYPEIYRMVYPMIQNACLKNTRPLTKELVDNMTEEIYFAIEDNEIGEVRSKEEISDKTSKQSELKSEDRQRIVRNRTLNDLIRILLLRELIGRPGFPNRPGFPGGPGFPGRPPRPRPPRPPMGPPPRPRPGAGPFNRDFYSSYENDYNIYEY